MRKKSHILLAKYLIERLQLHDMITSSLGFYVGSLKPDCKISVVTMPHTFEGTYEMIKEKIEVLHQKMEQGYPLDYSGCVQLGEIIHYIADYFTFPHNKHFEGNMMDHCHYENDLKLTLRKFIWREETIAIRRNIQVFQSKEEIFQFIEEKHREYCLQKSNVINDCRFILQVCMEVMASLVAILQNSYVEIKEICST